MIMKDGKVVTFEITYEQFSQLRYSVAKVSSPPLPFPSSL